MLVKNVKNKIEKIQKEIEERKKALDGIFKKENKEEENKEKENKKEEKKEKENKEEENKRINIFNGLFRCGYRTSKNFRRIKR